VWERTLFFISVDKRWLSENKYFPLMLNRKVDGITVPSNVSFVGTVIPKQLMIYVLLVFETDV